MEKQPSIQNHHSTKAEIGLINKVLELRVYSFFLAVLGINLKENDMNRASLSGLKRRAKTRLTKAQTMYQERGVKYWQQEVRKYEILLATISEYESDCEESE